MQEKKEEELIFQKKEIRDLFKVKKLIGQNFDSDDYRELLQIPILKKIFCNQEMTRSVDAFLNGNLNLAVSSHNAFIHRNTLIYRINKIKQTIGLDLKKFEDAALYVNAREIFKIIHQCQKCDSCKYKK